MLNKKSRLLKALPVAGLLLAPAAFAQLPPEEYYHSGSSGVGSLVDTTQMAGAISQSVLTPFFMPQFRRDEEQPTTLLSSDFTFNSLLRYERRDFKKLDDVYYDRYGLTLHGSFEAAEKLPIDILIPIDNINYSGPDGLRPSDYTRLGLAVTPRYMLMNQADHGIDLGLGLGGLYYHDFVEHGDDQDRVGLAPLVSLRKDFESFAVAGGAMFQRDWNLSGDEHPNGESYLDTAKVGFNVGIPLGDRVVLNTHCTYNYLLDMPSEIDPDFFTVGAGLTWLLQDNWTLDLNVQTDLDSNEYRNWEAMTGLIWSF